MTKKRNKLPLLVCTIIIALAVFLPIIASGSVYENSKPDLYLYSGPRPATTQTVWLNGGKNDIPIGVSIDSKVKQLNLYESYNSEWFDVTGAKTVKWIALAFNEDGDINYPTDFKSAKSEQCAVTVTKGKVSAKAAGTAVVCALKSDEKGELVATEYCLVEVLVGAAKLAFVDAKKQPVKNLSVGIGGSQYVYLDATAQAEIDRSESYIFQFDKDGGEYAEFGNGKSVIAMSQSMLEDRPLEIVGKALKGGKPTKVTITARAENSGKTAKLSLTVDNKIYTTSQSVPTVNMAYSSGGNAQHIVSAEAIDNMLLTYAQRYSVSGADEMPTTDKPKVFVTSDRPTVSNMIDAKGNLKSTGTKHPSVTAKLDKEGNLSIVLKKAATSMPSSKCYVTIGYNGNTSGSSLTGCIIFQVDIEGITVLSNKPNNKS